MKTMCKTVFLGLGISIAATGALAANSADNNYNNNNNYNSQMGEALTPQSFTTQASISGDKEVALSQMALDKSQNPQVRQFAQRMVNDHSRANQKLTTIADRQGLACAPTNYFSQANWSGLNIENPKGLPAQALMQSFNGTNADFQTAKYLDTLSGSQFDQAYINCMVRDHQQAVQLFTDASQNLQDQQLKNFASRTLPVLQHHLSMAQNLQSQIANGTTPNTTGAAPDQNNTIRTSGNGM